MAVVAGVLLGATADLQAELVSSSSSFLRPRGLLLFLERTLNGSCSPTTAHQG